jgi:hypothetical protein
MAGAGWIGVCGWGAPTRQVAGVLEEGGGAMLKPDDGCLERGRVVGCGPTPNPAPRAPVPAPVPEAPVPAMAGMPERQRPATCSPAASVQHPLPGCRTRTRAQRVWPSTPASAPPPSTPGRPPGCARAPRRRTRPPPPPAPAAPPRRGRACRRGRPAPHACSPEGAPRAGCGAPCCRAGRPARVRERVCGGEEGAGPAGHQRRTRARIPIQR